MPPCRGDPPRGNVTAGTRRTRRGATSVCSPLVVWWVHEAPGSWWASPFLRTTGVRLEGGCAERGTHANEQAEATQPSIEAEVMHADADVVATERLQRLLEADAARAATALTSGEKLDASVFRKRLLK